MKNMKIILSTLLIALVFVLIKAPKASYAEENLTEKINEVTNSISENETLITEYEESIEQNKIDYEDAVLKADSFNERIIKLEKNRYYVKERIHFLESKEMVFMDRFIAALTNSYDEVSEDDLNYLLEGDFKSFEEVLNKKLKVEDKNALIEKLKSYELLNEISIEYENEQNILNEDKKIEIENSITELENKLAEAHLAIENLESTKQEVEQKIIEEQKRLEEIRKSETFIMPTTGRITSRFGYRNHPILRRRILHSGVDIANSVGTAVKAARNGRVIFAGVKGTYGNTIIIDHGKGIKTLYAHLSRINVSNGSVVSQGNKIGSMGSTGRSTGRHLHFEIQKNGTAVNPLGEM